MSTLDLSRLQFALTTLFHFVFVPLTMGLTRLVAVIAPRPGRSTAD